MHKSIFPSYLKTFNFKVHWDLLPVKNKFHRFALDSNEKITCLFCNINIESNFHLFAKCSKLRPLWNMLDEVIKECFNGQRNFSFQSDRVYKGNFHLIHSKTQKKYEKIILYVNTITNYNIWEMRNKSFHENEVFELLKLMNKISGSMFARKNIEKNENRLTTCKKVDFLNEFHITFGSIKDAMFDPG